MARSNSTSRSVSDRSSLTRRASPGSSSTSSTRTGPSLDPTSAARARPRSEGGGLEDLRPLRHRPCSPSSAPACFRRVADTLVGACQQLEWQHFPVSWASKQPSVRLARPWNSTSTAPSRTPPGSARSPARPRRRASPACGSPRPPTTPTSPAPWLPRPADRAGARHRRRHRLPPQPDGHRPGGVGPGRAERRAVHPRARHAGEGPPGEAVLRARRNGRRPGSGSTSSPCGPSSTPSPSGRRCASRASSTASRCSPTSSTPALSRWPTRRSTWPASTSGSARVAGEVADGFCVHPLNSPQYLSEVVRPSIEEGAKQAGRDATARCRWWPPSSPSSANPGPSSTASATPSASRSPSTARRRPTGGSSRSTAATT